MFDLDKWNEILQTITRNKTRSLLTAFGIFWGIFMLVLLLGGGQGARGLLMDNFEGFAQNTAVIAPMKTTMPFKGYGSGRTWSLDLDDIRHIKREVDGIDICTPLLGDWGIAKRGDRNCDIAMQGNTTDYDKVEKPDIAIGRGITKSDLRERRKVCVIGRRVREELFPGSENPLGHHIEINGVYYQVVGVNMTKSNIGAMGEPARKVCIPLTTFQQVYNKGREVEVICITAQPDVTTESLESQIRRVVYNNHFIAPDDESALQYISLEAIFRMVDNLFTGLNFLIWLVGIGTLVSGVIGVSNIMMVTVRERTVEIGIRRAIGARPASILGQIMTESIVITTMAGLSGICFAVLILSGLESLLATSDMKANFLIPFPTAAGAALALALLGALAGLAPSLRALTIRPIDAIRDE